MPLNAADNARLTLIERGAPMGRYLKATQWFPAVVSCALLAGEPPYAVRLLGENYVAFRASDGRVGFFDEGCPHRGASLLLARNEDNALRCIFHGWKFRVDGVTVEAPTQARDRAEFCRRVPLRHYPTHEAAGIVWVWLGGGAPAPLPDYEFMQFTGEHIWTVRSIQDFNWLQSIEGLVDSAHVSILHQDWIAKMSNNPTLANAAFDAAPVYEFDDRPNGFRYAGIRHAEGDRRYIRVTEYARPWFCFIPSDQGACFMPVPIDDEHTAFWAIRYDATRPIADSPWKPAPDPMNWPPPLPGGRAERWGQNRAQMKRGSFSGFDQHFLHEDLAVAASQGIIADRSKEFLNAGDAAVVRMRKDLLATLDDFESSGPRPAVPSALRIKAGQLLLGPDVDWRAQPIP
jgi:nitrite reductase/ring-hydroxylating ferredoxin subunit